jgi:hypothetical protein
MAKYKDISGGQYSPEDDEKEEEQTWEVEATDEKDVANDFPDSAVISVVCKDGNTTYLNSSISVRLDIFGSSPRSIHLSETAREC